jgi:hypothetical protein
MLSAINRQSPPRRWKEKDTATRADGVLGLPQETQTMFSLSEIGRQSGLQQNSGSVELNTDCYRNRRPAWLVLLKLLGVVGMIAVGAAIAIPSLLEFEFPLWHAIAITAGGMLAYTGIAFFVRPDPNTDNLDHVNKFLWNLHCALGPGRFTSETFLDLGVLVGLVKGEEVQGATAGPLPSNGPAGVNPGLGGLGTFDPSRPIAPLDPNRFALSSANSVTEKIQRDSQRFYSPPPTAAS